MKKQVEESIESENDEENNNQEEEVEEIPREIFVEGPLMTSKTLKARNMALEKTNVDQEYVKVETETKPSFYVTEEEPEHQYQTLKIKRKIRRSRLKRIDELVIVVPEESKQYKYVEKPGLLYCCTIS